MTVKASTKQSAERELAGFIAKFTPEMGAAIRAARRKMRALLPRASELVYDNYNFFVIGYGAGERTSDAILSLGCQASGITLFLLQGKTLPDPDHLLAGSGAVVRSMKLESPGSLDRKEVRALVASAAARSRRPFDSTTKHELLIKSVSSKQRPRRKPEAAKAKKRG